MTLNGTMFPYGVDILKPQVGIQYVVSYKFYAADGAAHSPCTHGSNVQTKWSVSEEGSNLDFNYYVGRTILNKSIPRLNRNDCFYKYESLVRDDTCEQQLYSQSDSVLGGHALSETNSLHNNKKPEPLRM